jgi:photosystem II stability/assembly factor-like uncharacterized protein
MLKTAFAGTLAAIAIAALAATAADSVIWRDVLDTPAVKSPLASRALLNGLAKAGSRIVAVGQRGHVVQSEDGGKSWQQAEVPVSSDLVAVTFANDSTGWAVGHDGVVLRTTNAGATWAKQLDGRAAGTAMVDFYTREANGIFANDAKRGSAMLDEAKRFAAQGAENPLFDVWFENDKSGFVVGAFGLILRTNDGGASWEPLLHAVDNPKALHLYSVRSVGSDVWIAGEQGLLLKLDRQAKKFNAVELPYKGTLFGIVGNERAVLVHGLRGTVLRSTDSGKSWQPVDTGLQVGLTASAIDAEGRIFVVSQAGHILVSRDDGASFKPVRVERPIPAAAVLAAARDAVVVAGPRGVQTQPLQ